MLRDQVKISPYNNMPRTSNLDKIVESAEIAMKRFTKRMNDEGYHTMIKRDGIGR